jgi:hypothetical protein
LTERINEHSYFLHNGRAQLGGNCVMAGREHCSAMFCQLAHRHSESTAILNNHSVAQPARHNKMFETQHYLFSGSITIANINQRYSCHINKWRIICLEAVSVIYLYI